MNKEYYQLQLEAGLSNKQVEELFNINRSTRKRWRNGSTEAPEAVILCLKSIIQNKPVNKVK